MSRLIFTVYLLPGCKSDALFCYSPWKKRWTGKGRPRSVARAARYPQTTDSRQIRWVSFFPAKRISIYLYIYIFPIYYWLLFILVYPLFALHFYTYIHRLLITVIVSLIRNRRQERRIADETTMYLRQVPLSCNCNYILQCIVYRVTVIIMTKSRRIVRNVLPDDDIRGFEIYR